MWMKIVVDHINSGFVSLLVWILLHEPSQRTTANLLPSPFSNLSFVILPNGNELQTNLRRVSVCCGDKKACEAGIWSFVEQRQNIYLVNCLRNWNWNWNFMKVIQETFEWICSRVWRIDVSSSPISRSRSRSKSKSKSESKSKSRSRSEPLC